jgi:hypothetical protein
MKHLLETPSVANGLLPVLWASETIHVLQIRECGQRGKILNLDALGIRVEHALAQSALSLQNRAEPGLPGEPGTHGGGPRGATGTAVTGADGAEPISVNELRQQI